MEYQSVIGLEIHVELKTKTKMFCSCLNNSEEKTPNLNVCPVCLGHPGALPVINQEAVKSVLKFGYALNAEVAKVSKFDRKNYFYPDLPKGYQISQYDMPLVENGYLEIYLPSKADSDLPPIKKIRIKRVHLEEDAGKLCHIAGECHQISKGGVVPVKMSDSKSYTLVDFNRAGVPLAELVTEPDLSSAEEARRFGEELRAILRYLGIANADMERGELRCEVNISLKKESDSQLGTKVEVKNLNSFKAVEQSIAYEIKRQSEILESGKKVIHETRGWNEAKGETVSQRKKEEAHDYRYFPEPDLLPLKLSELFDLSAIKISVLELAIDKRLRFMKEYGLKFKEVDALALEPESAIYFEEIISELDLLETTIGEKREKRIKLVFNYFSTDLRGMMISKGLWIKDLKFTPHHFAHLIDFVDKNMISSKAAKMVLIEMFERGIDPEDIIKEQNLMQVSDVKDLETIIQKVIANNPQPVQDFKKGKENSLQFLIGQVIKESKGKANPAVVLDELKKFLK